MPLPLIPVGIGLFGLFAGSQLDDAVEESFKTPYYGESKSFLPSTSTIIKAALLSSIAFIGFKQFKRLVK